MTTVRFLSPSALWRAKTAGNVPLVLVALCVVSGAVLSAQEPPRHWLHGGVMPPGAIGAQRLLRNGPLSVNTPPPYVQAVEVLAGERSVGTELEQPAPTISIATHGGWSDGHAGRLLVGLQVGRPYRLRVSGVKLYEETEVYPTIELIDRLHPPPGKALRFPVPIELTTEELQMAARGSFVTRVIYVEDPTQAVPFEQKEGQPYIEAAAGDDPLLAADQLGRPIAILRIGARGPSSAGPDAHFTFGGPPVRLYSGRALHGQQAVFE